MCHFVGIPLSGRFSPEICSIHKIDAVPRIDAVREVTHGKRGGVQFTAATLRNHGAVLVPVGTPDFNLIGFALTHSRGRKTKCNAWRGHKMNYFLDPALPAILSSRIPQTTEASLRQEKYFLTFFP